MQEFHLLKSLGAIETSLENKNASGSGNGLLSGASSQAVLNGEANETKLLLFTDGGSGSNEDVAVVFMMKAVIQKRILRRINFDKCIEICGHIRL